MANAVCTPNVQTSCFLCTTANAWRQFRWHFLFILLHFITIFRLTHSSIIVLIISLLFSVVAPVLAKEDVDGCGEHPLKGILANLESKRKNTCILIETMCDLWEHSIKSLQRNFMHISPDELKMASSMSPPISRVSFQFSAASLVKCLVWRIHQKLMRIISARAQLLPRFGANRYISSINIGWWTPNLMNA